jgi:hypothetical protein
MSGIFISYRRSDESVVTYRLSDELKRIFGEKNIFLDVESISPGLPFADAIQQSLNQCSVVLIIIGPQWLNITGDDGERRLNDINDWVRQEVKLALLANVRVIPVLVQDASMPEKDQLPDDIKGLSDLHAFSISSAQTHWSFDVERLTEKIAQTDKELAKILNNGSDVATGYSHKVMWGLGIGLFLGLTYLVEGWEDQDEVLAAIFFCAVGIGLSYFGFTDIQNGKSKGKGFAIAGMIVSGLLMLSSFGNLAMYNDDVVYVAEPEKPVVVQQEIIKEKPKVDPPPSPPPKKKTPPRIVNIAGIWMTSEGVRYQVMQSGNQISFVEYTVFGVPFGEGSGSITGNQYYFNYYSAVSGVSGQGIGNVRGDTISINFTDAFNNTQAFEIYRQ